MLGVFALGSEYGWDTLKTLFTQRPGRLRVFAAKLIALASCSSRSCSSLFAAGAVASLVIAADRGRPGELPAGLAARCARSPRAGSILAVWAALGVLLGVLTRGTSLAIGVGILYALVVEGLLSAFADSVSRCWSRSTQVLLRTNGYSLAAALGTPLALDRVERARLVLRAVRGQRAGRRRARAPRRRLRRRSPRCCCAAATSPDSRLAAGRR